MVPRQQPKHQGLNNGQPHFLDRRPLVETWPGAIIAGSSIVCFTVLVFCRFKMLPPWYRPYWKSPAAAIVLSHEDFIALVILSFVSLLLCFLSPRLRRYIASTHCILIIF